jgi:hypothetical protein
MHFARARRENNGVQPLPNEAQHPKAPLTVCFAGVFLHHCTRSIELLYQGKWQVAISHIAGIFNRVEGDFHVIYCAYNKFECQVGLRKRRLTSAMFGFLGTLAGCGDVGLRFANPTNSHNRGHDRTFSE